MRGPAAYSNPNAFAQLLNLIPSGCVERGRDD